jgi:hypothetical protein
LPDSDAIASTPRELQWAGETVLDQFVACFEGLEDPRTGNAGLHDFYEMLMIALCAVLCVHSSYPSNRIQWRLRSGLTCATRLLRIE